MKAHISDLREQFGAIDIYLFDQLLRGRITPHMRVLDVGCGAGRNVHYLLREGFNVHGVDGNPDAIAAVRALAAQLAPHLSRENFRTEAIETMSFASAFADVVVCNAVLHFAADETHFDAMLAQCWRVLKPGGLFFCRLASSIGMENRVQHLSHGRYVLPDGSERFLVDEAMLMNRSIALGGVLLDPLKTTIVQDQRCMTTWVLCKDVE